MSRQKEASLWFTIWVTDPDRFLELVLRQIKPNQIWRRFTKFIIFNCILNCPNRFLVLPKPSIKVFVLLLFHILDQFFNFMSIHHHSWYLFDVGMRFLIKFYSFIVFALSLVEFCSIVVIILQVYSVKFIRDFYGFVNFTICLEDLV